jgi:hypothetical protein
MESDRPKGLAARFSRLAIGGAAAGVALAVVIVFAGTVLVDGFKDKPPPKAVAPLSVETSSSSAFKILGFRTAQFGMKEDDLRAALGQDFGVSSGNLTATEEVGLGTRTISFLLDGLVSGAGIAQLSYTFGHQGQDLIQIAVIWGGANRPEAGLPQVEAAAAELKRYMRSLPFDPGMTSYDLPQPDGSILLARARDRENRAVVLIRSDPVDGAGVKRPMLQLIYLRNEKQPDVFRIQKGQF